MKNQNAITVDELIDAITTGNIDLVKAYIVKKPTLVNDYSIKKEVSPLGAAVLHKENNIGQLLLENGAVILTLLLRPLNLVLNYHL